METLFKEYKTWLAGQTIEDRKSFLAELKDYAEIYFGFPSEREIDEIAYSEWEKRFFHVIDNLQISTIYPLILFMYNRVAEAERASLFELLESYLCRRSVCRLTTKNYNNLFIEIMRGLVRISTDQDRAFTNTDLLNILLAFDDETNRFPDDEEFRQGFRTASLSNKTSSEILFCLALRQKGNPNSDVQKINSLNLSVEHMMPRKWEDNWSRPGLTESEKEQRNQKLRTLGNLTLVTQRLNSKMQNAAWADKKQFLSKFSSLEMTTQYLPLSDWDESTISSRCEELLRVALQIWPRPESHIPQEVRDMVAAMNPDESASMTVRDRLSLCDTIIVPAKPENFKKGFLENKYWRAIRISDIRKKQIKYIAAYQIRPVSAITHIAEVASIEPDSEEGYCLVRFKGPAREIRHIPSTPKSIPYGPGYTNYDLLQTAKTIEDLKSPDSSVD